MTSELEKAYQEAYSVIPGQKPPGQYIGCISKNKNTYYFYKSKDTYYYTSSRTDAVEAELEAAKKRREFQRYGYHH